MTVEWQDRFWAKVAKSDDCWEWTGACQPDRRYGRFMLAGRARKAHRVAWELAFGPIPTGLCVLHRCDNPPCVKPAHLFLGTLRDNALDMGAKGRQTLQVMPHLVRRGSAALNAKLTEALVADIRVRLDAGARHKPLAREFGVSQRTIQLIHERRSWAHV